MNDTKPLAKSEPPALTLYSIEHELQELIDLRETAVEEGELPDTIAAIDKQIENYFGARREKVDGICYAYRTYQYSAEAAHAEAQRMLERAKRLQNRADQIKARALQTMQDHGVKRLESPTNTLRVQANGGLQALEIDNWPRDASGNFKPLTSEESWGLISPNVAVKTFILPAIDRIRETLSRRVTCPECDGHGFWEKTTRDIDEAPERQTCLRCEGKGTVSATIPGARLLPRGEHLRIG